MSKPKVKLGKSLKAKILAQLYADLVHEIAPAQDLRSLSDLEALVPHGHLRLALLSNPAMAALLPLLDVKVVPAELEDAPFRMLENGILSVPSAAILDPTTLAFLLRWAVELKRLLGMAEPATAVAKAQHFAFGLYSLLPSEASRQLALDLVPQQLHNHLTTPAVDLRDLNTPYIQSLFGYGSADHHLQAAVWECDSPLERILTGGGDSRLLVTGDNNLNRYGVPPYPRPHAVHFSSSTASAISDHGFLLCEKLRLDLQAAQIDRGLQPADLRELLLANVTAELRRSLALSAQEADVCVSPSGTDAELMTVLFAVAGRSQQGLEAILVAPDESGRGVKLAAAGSYFDDLSATGYVVKKGQQATELPPLTVHDVPIRDASGKRLSRQTIEMEIAARSAEIHSRGNAILLHMLLSSKTGLSAPSTDFVTALAMTYGQDLDVVVDACQMRVPAQDLGAAVRRGWMVQVSGSKFLTGPPFSGALLTPASMRKRSERLSKIMASAPAVGHMSDWSAPFATTEVAGAATSGLGPLFRWIPALAEARLFENLEVSLKARCFETFRDIIAKRIAQSAFLKPIDEGWFFDAEQDSSFMKNTILSFQVVVPVGHMKQALNEDGCRKIFEWLNADMSDRLPGLSPREKSLVSIEAHLGQPVALGSHDDGICVLRMVLGARFFNFVGYCGVESDHAALHAEIEDAKRAIAKLEILAANWQRLEAN